MSDDPGEARESHRPPVLRTGPGRWLGGVCAGFSAVTGLRLRWLRLAFAVAGVCAGIGVVVYAACWLIIPSDDGSTDPAMAAERGSRVAVLGWTATGLIAVALLAAIGAIATLFNLGWVIFGVSAVAVAALLTQASAARRLGALTLVCALALPAVAVALTPFRLSLRSGDSVVAPASAARVRATIYNSGLGTLLVDLRHTRLPAHGAVPLRIDAGLRRTIVALPHNRCVRVVIHYQVHTFPLHLAALLTGREGPLFSGIVLFGRTSNPTLSITPAAIAHGAHGFLGTRSLNDVNGAGRLQGESLRKGPTLEIDFRSEGGSLFVRDYPNTVSPDLQPNWPGVPPVPERPPTVSGLSRRLARFELRHWRARRRAELRARELVDALLPGPCARSAEPASATAAGSA
ncbi:MAG: PspC domain-containing protein [Solirubrobacteraceae bacterium]